VFFTYNSQVKKQNRHKRRTAQIILERLQIETTTNTRPTHVRVSHILIHTQGRSQEHLVYRGFKFTAAWGHFHRDLSKKLQQVEGVVLGYRIFEIPLASLVVAGGYPGSTSKLRPCLHVGEQDTV